MALPSGAKWIYDGKLKIGVRLSGGSVVRRGEGEKLGARESGYKNPGRERADTAKRNDFLMVSKSYAQYVRRARRTSKATKTRFDQRELKVAYWRAHRAGLNYQASKGRLNEREIRMELQRAMTALGRLAGNADFTWPKGGDTP
jgi:hypothetical protein